MNKFEIGMKVIYKGEEHEVTDVDEGYDYLALDGDRYITPNHEENRCISAPMSECDCACRQLTKLIPNKNI